MKRLLTVLAFVSITAVASAQATSQGTSIDRGLAARPRGVQQQSPPITNPEPMTLVALAGGAAVAGGLLRRRKQTKA